MVEVTVDCVQIVRACSEIFYLLLISIVYFAFLSIKVS